MREATIRRRTWLILLMLAWVPPTTAQEKSEPFTYQACVDSFKTVAAATRPTLISDEKKRVPLGASDSTPDLQTAASLSAGDGDGRAFITFSTGEEKVGTVNWALKASVPFDKDTGEGVFVSRAGVSGDVVLTASVNRYGWDLELEPYGLELCRRCEDADIELLKDCHSDNETVYSPQERPPEGMAELTETMFGNVVTTMWGLEGSIGRKERSYFDMDAEKQDEDRPALAFSLLGGLRLSSSSLFAKLTGKRDYGEGTTVQKCVAVEGMEELDKCQELPLGRAEEKDGLVASMQWVKPLGGAAIGPAADYDFEASEWTLRLPIYLIRNDDDDWVAGLKLAWTSDGDEDLGVAIFVTKPLEF